MHGFGYRLDWCNTDEGMKLLGNMVCACIKYMKGRIVFQSQDIFVK